MASWLKFIKLIDSGEFGRAMVVMAVAGGTRALVISNIACI